jgi:hypothetical protein
MNSAAGARKITNCQRRFPDGGSAARAALGFPLAPMSAVVVATAPAYLKAFLASLSSA